MTDTGARGKLEPTEKNPQKAKILLTEFVTHDVKRFIVEKPAGYEFIPGQANLVAIDKDGLRDELRPFTFTSLNEDEVLEFTIKKYPEHDAITKKIHELEPGDQLILHEPFGTLIYQSPGTFLAAGAGITPFLGITRHLRKHGRIEGNSMIFSNKKVEDVIVEKELRDTFGDDLTLTLTRESQHGYEHARIDEEFLKDRIDLEKYFYICGPDSFVKDLRSTLIGLGVDEERIIVEKIIFMH